MSRTLLLKDGERIPCPVCHLVRGELSYLEFTKPMRRVVDDRQLRCANCDRTWESVRYFFDYYATRVVPKIEAEMQERNIVHDKDGERRFEEWKWSRERKAKAAIEEGTWHPTLSDHHLR